LRQTRGYGRKTALISGEVTPVELTIGTELTFNQILLEAIDDTLSSLSESVKKSLYYHLEKIFNIKKYEIPYRIDDFSDALERIFGLGARPLEIMLIKHLHNRIGIDCKWDLPKWVVPELTFKQYVLLMKQNFEKAGTNDEEIEVFMDAREEQ
jgi:hypothetical protein